MNTVIQLRIEFENWDQDPVVTVHRNHNLAENAALICIAEDIYADGLFHHSLRVKFSDVGHQLPDDLISVDISSKLACYRLLSNLKDVAGVKAVSDWYCEAKYSIHHERLNFHFDMIPVDDCRAFLFSHHVLSVDGIQVSRSTVHEDLEGRYLEAFADTEAGTLEFVFTLEDVIFADYDYRQNLWCIGEHRVALKP